MTHRQRTIRRILTLLILLAVAAASIRLIDGRVMQTLSKYAGHPRQLQHVAPADGSR